MKRPQLVIRRPSGTRLLTTRGRAFVVAGLTVAVVGIGLGFQDVIRIGLLLLGLPVLAALLIRRPAGLAVTRATDPAQLVADEPAQVYTTVTNTGNRGTAFMLATERLGKRLGQSPRILLAAVGPAHRRTIRYAVRPTVRGRHRLGPLTVHLRDPFGLTRRSVDVGATTEIIVLPRIDPLPGRRPSGSGLGTEGEIPHLVALHGEDDQSIREYRDGDDLRRIHWPTTARTGSLVVRQEDRPSRRRAVLMLDPRRPAHVGTGPGSSFEWGVRAMASVLNHVNDVGYAVHLLTPETVRSGQVNLATDPANGLRVLAVTETVPSAEAEQLVQASHSLLAPGGLCVAIVVAFDDTLVSRLARQRPSGVNGLALVVPGPADQVGTIGTARAVELFTESGWRATAVRPGDTISTAWPRVASRDLHPHRGTPDEHETIER
ncbi:MAG: DUF58 domain-containing protein [Actinomycetales bacterium]|nr:MAG: DUF58 domain-containing protein [Actinomycetales bacterium]